MRRWAAGGFRGELYLSLACAGMCCSRRAMRAVQAGRVLMLAELCLEPSAAAARRRLRRAELRRGPRCPAAAGTVRLPLPCTASEHVVGAVTANWLDERLRQDRGLCPFACST